MKGKNNRCLQTSRWSEINEFFQEITIYKVRKFFHIKEIHCNNGER